MRIVMQFGSPKGRRRSRNFNLVRSLIVVGSLVALAPACHAQTAAPASSSAPKSSSEKLVGHAAVEAELVARGITQPRILTAMRKTPQYDFLPLRLRGPLPQVRADRLSTNNLFAVPSGGDGCPA